MFAKFHEICENVLKFPNPNGVFISEIVIQLLRPSTSCQLKIRPRHEGLQPPAAHRTQALSPQTAMLP